MASFAIQSGRLPHRSVLPITKSESNHIFSSNSIFPVSDSAKKFKFTQLTVSASSATSSDRSIVPTTAGKEVTADSDSEYDYFFELVESWMHTCVYDIVLNLKRAPLLVQVFSLDDKGRGRIKYHTERAIMGKWSLVMENWRSGESEAPDGLIFVEELDEKPQKGGDGETKAWGIVVQGKGISCGPLCYLLKTDRVCAGVGLGYCTHFCLMKVSNFSDSAWDQFTEYWLSR